METVAMVVGGKNSHILGHFFEETHYSLPDRKDTVHAMTIIARVISFALFLVYGVLVSAEATAPLDTIVIQLRSQSDSKNSELLDEVLHVTSKFLSDYCGAYYAKTEPSDYFNEVRITGNTFGIQGSSRSFITTIEFDGVLAFNSEQTPSPSFITNLLTNAFKGLNLNLYLKNLVASDDPFLKDLTHAFIEVAGQPVTDTRFQDQPEVSESNSTDEGFKLEEWAEIAIYTTAGIVGALILVALVCLCRCWFGQGGKVQDTADVIKVRKIEFASPVSEPDMKQSKSKKSIAYGGRKSQKVRDGSLSPMRSIVSQDSSMFTYNPTGVSRDVATLSLGSISNINISTPNFDLEAWQRPNIISPKAPAPFGQDISAIEQKDHLSLIEEEDDDVLHTRGSQRQSKKKKFSSRDKRSTGSRHYTKNYPNTIHQPYSRKISTDESFSSSSDVINDLKNLSLQIDQHRGVKSYQG